MAEAKKKIPSIEGEEKKEKLPAIPYHEILDRYFAHRRKGLLYVEDADVYYLLQKEKYWKLMTPKRMRKELWNYVKTDLWPGVVDEGKFAPRPPTMALVEELYKSAQFAVTEEMEEETFADRYITFKDEVYDAEELRWSQKDPFVKRSSFYIKADRAEVESVTKAPPEFQKYLDTSLVLEDGVTPDPELHLFAQEMMGYFLYPRNPNSAAFFLYGTGSNGKSRLGHFMRNSMLGKEYCTALSIRALTENAFNLPALIGKRANINMEEQAKFSDSSLFKALTGDDAVNGERKFGDIVTFQPTAKFMFSCNRRPTFDSSDYAMKRRIHILPFFRKFDPRDKDTDIDAKLAAEKTQIIGWAMRGLERLKAQKWEFTRSESMRKMMKEQEEENSGVVEWFRDNWETVKDDAPSADDHWVENTKLYKEYLEWTKDNGRNHVSSQKFGQELSSSCACDSEKRSVPDMSYMPRCRRVRRIGPVPVAHAASAQKTLPIPKAEPWEAQVTKLDV